MADVCVLGVQFSFLGIQEKNKGYFKELAMSGIPQTESISAASPSQRLTSVAKHAHQIGKKSLKPLKGAKSVGGIFRNVASFAEVFKSLSKSVQGAMHVSKAPNIILGLVSIKHSVDDVRKILDKTKRPQERVKASLLFVTHIDSIINTVATICKILTSVAKVSSRAIQWIPIFNMISFAVSFISLGLSAHSTHQGRKLASAFNASMRAYEAASTPEEKASALAQALSTIESEGIDPLRKQLMISKKGKVELIKRIDTLRAHIYSHAVTEEDAKLVKMLQGRARTQLAFQVADLSSTVAGIAGSALLFIPDPTGATQATGFAILAATGVVSLGVWAGKYFFINKDPFDENSRNRAMTILNEVSSAIHSLKERLQTFAIGKKRVHNPAMAA